MSQKEVSYKIFNDTIDDSIFNGGLCDLYAAVFSEPPEYQKWSDDEVCTAFRTYAKNGASFVIAYSDQMCVAFCVIMPLAKTHRINEEALSMQGSVETSVTLSADFFASQDIDMNLAWYIADLGVDNMFRGRGVGSWLMKQALALIPETAHQVVLRVSLSNERALNWYATRGFKLLGTVKQNAIFKDHNTGAFKVIEKGFMMKRI